MPNCPRQHDPRRVQARLPRRSIATAASDGWNNLSFGMERRHPRRFSSASPRSSAAAAARFSQSSSILSATGSVAARRRPARAARGRRSTVRWTRSTTRLRLVTVFGERLTHLPDFERFDTTPPLVLRARRGSIASRDPRFRRGAEPCSTRCARRVDWLRARRHHRAAPLAIPSNTLVRGNGWTRSRPAIGRILDLHRRGTGRRRISTRRETARAALARERRGGNVGGRTARLALRRGEPDLAQHLRRSSGRSRETRQLPGRAPAPAPWRFASRSARWQKSSASTRVSSL